MQKRLICTFLFHLFGLSLLLIPNRFQGPVVAVVSDIGFRVIDVLAIILMMAGSVYLYSSLYLCLKSQRRMAEQCRCPDNDTVEKSE